MMWVLSGGRVSWKRCRGSVRRITTCVMWCRAEEDRGRGHGEEATWPTPPHGAATSSSWPLPSLQASSLLLSSLP